MVFPDKYSCGNAPLAAALFRVYGVKQVMLSANAVTVTKEKDVGWDLVKPNIELVMSQFFEADIPAAYPDPEDEYAFFVCLAIDLSPKTQRYPAPKQVPLFPHNSRLFTA